MREEPLAKAKPFDIPKRMVWEAYQRVTVNRGAAGVDDQSIEAFDQDVKNNLFKLWNRLSSGSYFPPPVKRVTIKKRDGGSRPLGIPTVSDRIAQGVVKAYLEPELERHFHSDSYGYRPGKSALEAVGVARQRCWRYDWVLDLDIQAFFDTIPHDLLLRAVRKHTDCKWVLLYIERWLTAPVQLEDGTLEPREKGTPQGSVVSPLLANLFLHYAFDRWMAQHHPDIPFERFADDAVCHCSSELQARRLQTELKRRFAECGLTLHPSKTQIVYCKDNVRRGHYPIQKFDFLGYTFRPRMSMNRWGKTFVNFSSNAAGTGTTVNQRLLHIMWKAVKVPICLATALCSWQLRSLSSPETEPDRGAGRRRYFTTKRSGSNMCDGNARWRTRATSMTYWSSGRRHRLGDRRYAAIPPSETTRSCRPFRPSRASRLSDMISK